MSKIHKTKPPRVMTSQAKKLQKDEMQKAVKALGTAANAAGSVAKKVAKNVANNAISNATAFAAGATVGYAAGKHTNSGSRIVSAISGGIVAVAANQGKTYADNRLKLGDKIFGGSN